MLTSVALDIQQIIKRDFGAPVTLTDEAATRAREFIAEDPHGTHLRMMVLGGGCSGFKYHLTVSVPEESDFCYEQDGVPIAVDNTAMTYLIGSTLEWKSEGLTHVGFEFDNPNAVSGCGCGSSFRMTPWQEGDCGPGESAV